MPKEMRFCRSCGNRLGEGPAEYTETVRFPNATAAANGRFTGRVHLGHGAPISQQTGHGCRVAGRRLGFSGMTWMWIVLGLFFASGGGLSMLVKTVTFLAPVFPSPKIVLIFGVDDSKRAPWRHLPDVVEPPDSPADKAGLVGRHQYEL